MPRDLKDVIASTSELAALPSTTVRLLEILDDTTVEALRVLAIIDKDPSLTANLLKLCNSAYYGMRRQVGSVKEALVLLGNKTVVTLAFATSMGDVLRGQLSAYRLAKDEMWHHSLATALAASYIMNEMNGPELRDRAFTAGLVHDVGKLLLNTLLLKELEQIPAAASGRALQAAEREILGFDHSEAGAALAESWNFPPMLVGAVFHHHRPEVAKEHRELILAVSAANILTEHMGLGGAGEDYPDYELMDGMIEAGVPEDAVKHVSRNLAHDLENLLTVIGEPVA